MAEFTRFAGPRGAKCFATSSTGARFVDYRNTEELRRMLTPNGKIQSRKRSGLSSHDQRVVSQAIKRARYMGLLPFTSATL